MSAFEYQGCTSGFDFEYAWMITKRERQPDGSDAWKDLTCSTNFNKTHTWACTVEPQRTVHVEADGAGRAFDIRIEKDLGADLARLIISPAIAELFRSREIAVCRSKELQPVSHEEMREKSRMRGMDGWLERKGDEYELVLSGYRLHLAYGAAPNPQLRIRCWDPPDVLMESAVSRRGTHTPG